MKISSSLIVLLSTCLIFTGCQTNILTESLIHPENPYNNPVYFTYDKSQETKILTLWDDFLSEYNAGDKVNLFTCDSITSYVTRVEFTDGIKVINNSNFTADDTDARKNIFNFFKRWEGLFGISVDSTHFDLHMSDGYIIFHIWQNRFRSEDLRYANDPHLHLMFKPDGTLWEIVSKLIPDAVITEPANIDTEKMMENIFGKTLTVNYGDQSHSVLFNSEYQYSVEVGNWIYMEKTSDYYSLYLLKGILARKFLWDGHYEEYSILCHPHTNEIIHIKTYAID